MSEYTDISDGSKNQPVLIDASDISVVSITSERTSKNKKETVISVSSSKEHNYFHVGTENWGIDPDKAIKSLQKTTPLIEIPFIWGDNSKIGTQYVNPACFNYIITSEPVIEKGDSEEHVAILLDVDGYGLVESYKVPVSVVDQFMSEVKKRAPNLVRIDTDEATARFVRPGYTVYNPDKIAQIYPNGFDVDLKFKSGGRIDFNITANKRELTQLFLDRFNKASEDKKKKIADTSQNLNELSSKMYTFRDKMTARTQREFARRVANDAGHLTHIKGARSPLYMQFNNVAFIQQRDNYIAFWFKKGTAEEVGIGGGITRADFKDKKRAKETLTKLLPLINKP